MKMLGLKRSFVAAWLVALATASMLGQHVGGEVHHKVGDDEGGWDLSTNVAAWSSGRIFKVGDIIWFPYSSAAKESVVELQSMGEFLACDLTNPIKMYTDSEGLDKVSLDGEGSRYFASGNLESCKKGLKIHVNVHPNDQNLIDDGSDFPPEEKPTPPYDPYPHFSPPDFPPEEKPTPPYDPYPHFSPPYFPPEEKPTPPDFSPPDFPPEKKPSPPYDPYPDYPPAGGSPPPPYPSGSTHMRGGLSFLLVVSALFWYLNF